MPTINSIIHDSLLNLRTPCHARPNMNRPHPMLMLPTWWSPIMKKIPILAAMVPPAEIRTADIRTSLLGFYQADHESENKMRCHRF